jgi:hypothetical protein
MRRYRERVIPSSRAHLYDAITRYVRGKPEHYFGVVEDCAAFELRAKLVASPGLATTRGEARGLRRRPLSVHEAEDVSDADRGHEIELARLRRYANVVERSRSHHETPAVEERDPPEGPRRESLVSGRKDEHRTQVGVRAGHAERELAATQALGRAVGPTERDGVDSEAGKPEYMASEHGQREVHPQTRTELGDASREHPMKARVERRELAEFRHGLDRSAGAAGTARRPRYRTGCSL